MRLEDALFFSPNYTYEKLDLTNVDQLIDAFEDRVNEFYFKPAKSLTDDSFSFAKGALTLASIDFAGFYFYGTNNSARIKQFCSELKSIKGLPKNEINEITKIINEDYRNGLIHDGRIKKLGQFALDIQNLIEITETFTMINPNILLSETEELFFQKLKDLRASQEERFQFRVRFTNNFNQEINSL